MTNDTFTSTDRLLEFDQGTMHANHQDDTTVSLDRNLQASGGAQRGMDWSRHIRIVAAVLLVISLTLVIMDSLGNKHIETETMRFLQWVELHPSKGALAVIGVYILATILFVPGSILTFGTGYAFGKAYESKVQGIAMASMTVFIGASLGSICTFLLGRYLFRSCVVRLASSYPIFQAIDRALQSNGLKIMILLRLSPLIPYNALDYMSGITAIPLSSYVIAMVGLLPGTISLCFIGASASSLTDNSVTKNMKLKVATIVIGVAFAAAGVFVASYYSKRELDRILSEEDTGDGLLLEEPANFADVPDEDVGDEEMRNRESL